MNKAILALAVILAVSGCTQQAQQQDAAQVIAGQNNGVDGVQAVKKGDVVKVEYVGSFTDGEIFDKSEGKGPLEFIAGEGQMIQGFDEAVMGMKLNEEKTITIPPEKAYGKAGSGQKLGVSLEQIAGDENINVGSEIYASNGTQGTVLEINKGIATVEFEHPLAGKTLGFWLKIVGIN